MTRHDRHIISWKYPLHRRLSDPTLQVAVIVALFSLTLSLLFFPGTQGTDDIHYATRALNVLSQGTLPEDASHQAGRVGTYLPLALVFGIFGAGDMSLGLIPVLCTVLTSIFIFLIAKSLFSRRVGLWAGLLYAVFPLTLRYGTMFVPEPILCAEICAAAMLLLKSDDLPMKRAFYLKLISGGIIGLAYLTSEVGAVFLPTFLIYQAVSGKLSKSDAALLAGFVLIVLGEGLYFTLAYGNPFHRYAVLGSVYTADPMVVDANRRLWVRLFLTYPHLLLSPGEGLGLFGPLLAAGFLFALYDFKRNRHLFLILWILAVFGFYNFMSLSLNRYVVLPAAVRLIYPGCLPLLILAAAFMVAVWDRLKSSFSRNAGRTVLGVLVLSSLLVGYLNYNISFPAVLARNAEAAARHLKNVLALTVLSDQRTLMCLRFYRNSSASDTLIAFEGLAAEDVRTQSSRKGADYVVINGPIYHIAENHSGFFPFDRRRRELMEHVISTADGPVFEFRYQRGKVFEKLYQSGAGKIFLNQWQIRRIDELFFGEKSSGWIRVF